MKKNNQFHNSIFDQTFVVILLIFILIMLIVVISPTYIRPLYKDLDNAANLGNALSGLLAPFVAICAAFVTFLAFWVQYKWNRIQRKDLAMERFENNFFELLHLHQGIVADLRNEESDENGKNPETDIGREVFDGLYERVEIEDEEYDYEGIKDFVENLNFWNHESLLNAKRIYAEQALIKTVDNYFSFTERVLCYIDESLIISEAEKKYYASFLRDTFNVDELLVMFYHCLLSENTGEMKRYIEKYSLFKNLRITDLAKESHKKLYADTAYM